MIRCRYAREAQPPAPFVNVTVRSRRRGVTSINLQRYWIRVRIVPSYRVPSYLPWI